MQCSFLQNIPRSDLLSLDIIDDGRLQPLHHVRVLECLLNFLHLQLFIDRETETLVSLTRGGQLTHLVV